MSSHLKCFNTIAAWDICVFAYGHEAAMVAALEMIRSGELSATHIKALEQHIAPIPRHCQLDRPIVAADVSDEDFERLRGKTTLAGYELISKKYPGGR